MTTNAAATFFAICRERNLKQDICTRVYSIRQGQNRIYTTNCIVYRYAYRLLQTLVTLPLWGRYQTSGVSELLTQEWPAGVDEESVHY